MNKKLSFTAGAALLALTILLAMIYQSSLGTSVSAEKQPPSDVGESYARDAIFAVCELGLMDTRTAVSGNVCFYPEEGVTRAELAYSLVNYLRLDTSKYGNKPLGFYDENAVPPSMLPYVRTALANGLMALQSDLLFHPTEKISREETAYLIGALCKTQIAAGKEENFSDFTDIGTYFQSNTKKLIDLGIMVGYNDGTFRPQKELSREELALILCRLLNDANFRKG